MIIGGWNLVRWAGYDFLTWRSFPSSAKIVNDEVPATGWEQPIPNIAVKPGAKISVSIQVKSENVLEGRTALVVYGSRDGVTWNSLGWKDFPLGTYDWVAQEFSFTVPSGVVMIKGWMPGGKGTPGTTWFDDLKIYQNDALIYSNDFSNWAPVIIPAEIITGVAVIKYLK